LQQCLLVDDSVDAIALATDGPSIDVPNEGVIALPCTVLGFRQK
jgi:hypothetical protein